MDSTHLASLFTDTVRVLSDCSEMQEKGFFHAYRDSDPMPSAKALDEIVALCRSVFFSFFCFIIVNETFMTAMIMA